METNCSKHTYKIILKKAIVSQHPQHFTGGYPPGISSDPLGFYWSYLSGMEVVQGALLFHWYHYRGYIRISWIYCRSSGRSQTLCLWCVYLVWWWRSEEWPDRRCWCKSEPAHCSRLESWPGVKSFKMRCEAEVTVAQSLPLEGTFIVHFGLG